MSKRSDPISDEKLKSVASRLPYPPTPDVAGTVIKSLESGGIPRIQVRIVWVLMGLLVLLFSGLFAVPDVRAQIMRFFQVGVVRIIPSTPTLTAEPSISQFPSSSTPITVFPSTATPAPGINEPQYTVTISGMAGETPFVDAQARLSFPIRLPKYPADLDKPDRVFLQEDGEMVILVWTDPTNPEESRLSLHEIGPGGILVSKYEPRVIQETQVNGEYAVWVQGPYLVQLTNGTYVFRRTVEGNTLIWEEDGITYRLETDLMLEEAVKIADSLD